MDNKKIDNNKVAKQLSDEEIKNVTGGMKIVVDEKPSWIQTILRFFFKVKS